MPKRKQQAHEQDQVAEQVMEAMLAGASLKDLRGISDEQMSDLYRYAFDFYEQGRLDDAERFFHFLCIYDFYNAQYWMGLAAVYQLKQNHQKAIDLYAVAFAQGKNDYRPMFYTGQCQMALGKPGKAKLCFQHVVERVEEPGMRAQAQAYLDALGDIEVDDSGE